MDSLNRLQEIFAHFPGIGPRQARRFVYYLLGKSPSFIKEFTDILHEAKKFISECSQCHRFFAQQAKENICSICSNQDRDTSTIMIVGRDSDFEAIERSGAYKGLYFILGGSVPLMDKEPSKRIRLDALTKRLGNSAQLKEIILSLNTTPDGEHTAHIVKEVIEKIPSLKNAKITLLGRGLSTGAELEYADGETIKSALKNRG